MSNVFVDMLENYAMPQIEEDRILIFQFDGTLPHEGLNRNFPGQSAGVDHSGLAI
jgi:hypothetical protein